MFNSFGVIKNRLVTYFLFMFNSFGVEKSVIFCLFMFNSLGVLRKYSVQKDVGSGQGCNPWRVSYK